MWNYETQCIAGITDYESGGHESNLFGRARIINNFRSPDIA
jgi:hypothetical protein